MISLKFVHCNSSERCKQCRPEGWRSSLIWVYTVCLDLSVRIQGKYYIKKTKQFFLDHHLLAYRFPSVCKNYFSQNLTGFIKWAATRQNQQSECAPSEDSDQPGHLPSLIWVFAVRMMKPWALSYPLSTQRRPWSDWGVLRLIWVFAVRTLTLLVLSCRGSNMEANFQAYISILNCSHGNLSLLLLLILYLTCAY